MFGWFTYLKKSMRKNDENCCIAGKWNIFEIMYKNVAWLSR